MRSQNSVSSMGMMKRFKPTEQKTATRSMTGFGRSEGSIARQRIVVELRALNSKQLDIHLKLPSLLKEQEPEIRKRLQSRGGRGKFEVGVTLEGGGEQAATIDETLAAEYHAKLSSLAERLGISSSQSDMLTLITRMPEVLQSPRAELPKEEIEELFRVLDESIDNLDAYRIEEGRSLHEALTGHVERISELRDIIPQHIDGRIDRIRDRIRKNLELYLEGKEIDESRFEQELLFYLEKYDVSEEMSRLKAHCDHFIETLGQGPDKGKKLGFIGQEMGREINTLGAKSYDADMQRIVVEMKDELEKVKEQVLNVL